MYHRIAVDTSEDAEYLLGGLDPVEKEVHVDDPCDIYGFSRVTSVIVCMLWGIVGVIVEYATQYWLIPSASDYVITCVLVYGASCLAASLLTILMVSFCMNRTLQFHSAVMLIHWMSLICITIGICTSALLWVRYSVVSGEAFSLPLFGQPPATNHVLQPALLCAVIGASLVLPLGVVHCCFHTKWMQRDEIYSISVVTCCALVSVASVCIIGVIVNMWLVVGATVAISQWNIMIIMVLSFVALSWAAYGSCVMDSSESIVIFLKFTPPLAICTCVCCLITVQNIMVLDTTHIQWQHQQQLIVGFVGLFAQFWSIVAFMSAAHWKDHVVFS